jgi:hypothetical protein
MRSESLPHSAAREREGRYIYLACPWTPMGGGMFKIADYLIQAQAFSASADTAELRPLDTRGGSNALYSFWVLATALARVVRGKLNGRLAGVHVNMAERLSLFRKSMIIIVCRALGIPVVLHLHAAQLHHFYRSLPRPLQMLTRWVFSLPTSCRRAGISRATLCDPRTRRAGSSRGDHYQRCSRAHPCAAYSR